MSQCICHSLWAGNIWEWCKCVLINSEATASALRSWVLSKQRYLWGEIASLAISFLRGGFFTRGLFLVSPGPSLIPPGMGNESRLVDWKQELAYSHPLSLSSWEPSEQRELPAESSHQSWKCLSVRAKDMGCGFLGPLAPAWMGEYIKSWVGNSPLTCR